MNARIRIMGSMAAFLVVVTLLAGVFAPLGAVQARGESVLPKSPYGTISDTTPTFRWTVVSGSPQYEFQLYKGGTFIYSKKVYGNCDTTSCTNTPTTTLSYASYKWQIRYWLGGSPSSWSAWKYFSIAPEPTSFNSSFNGSMTGWTKKPGAEWYVDGSQVYTSGLNGKWSSMYRSTSPAFANFDYEIKVRRDTADVNCLVARMGSSFASNNLGYPGYMFCYENGGQYFVVYMNSGGGAEYLQNWTATTYIKSGDWNRLRLVTVGPNFYFFINGKAVLALPQDSNRSVGSVGFSMYRTIDGFTEFDVDYANLNVLFKTAAPPDFVVDPAQQALNDAAMLEGDKGLFEGFPGP